MYECSVIVCDVACILFLNCCTSYFGMLLTGVDNVNYIVLYGWENVASYLVYN